MGGSEEGGCEVVREGGKRKGGERSSIKFP